MRSQPDDGRPHLASPEAPRVKSWTSKRRRKEFAADLSGMASDLTAAHSASMSLPYCSTSSAVPPATSDFQDRIVRWKHRESGMLSNVDNPLLLYGDQ